MFTSGPKRFRPPKPRSPKVPTIRRIGSPARVRQDCGEHAPRRVRITHMAADGRHPPPAARGTPAGRRRRLRGRLHRSGGRRVVHRGGGRGPVRGGHRRARTRTRAPASATSSSTATTATTASSPSAPSAPSAASPRPGAARTGTRTVPAYGPAHAAGTGAGRAAHLPEASPQGPPERAVHRLPDPPDHRAGRLRRGRPAPAFLPLTEVGNSCRNGLFSPSRWRLPAPSS